MRTCICQENDDLARTTSLKPGNIGISYSIAQNQEDFSSRASGSGAQSLDVRSSNLTDHEISTNDEWI